MRPPYVERDHVKSFEMLTPFSIVFRSNVVSHIVKPGGADASKNIQQTVISKLKKVFVEASLQRNYKLQETVVLTIGHLGRIAEGELLLVVIVSLLESLTANSQLIRAVAFKQASILR